MKTHQNLGILSIITGKSLTRKITISIVFAVTLISISSLAVHLIYMSRVNGRQMSEKSSQLTGYLKKSLELPLWNFNSEGVEKIGQMIMTNDIVSALTIKDSKGNLLFSRIRDLKDDMTKEQTVISYRGHIVGSFEIGLTRRLYHKQQQELVMVGMITILILISGILLTVILSVRQFMEKPLSDFSQGIDALANGNYQKSSISFDFIELESVTDHFNQMAVKIKNREKDLLKANDELKNEIKDRKNAELRLSESEKKYRSLNNNLPVGIFRIKPTGEILDYNTFLLKLLDIPPDTDLALLKGEHFYKNPEDRKTMIKTIAENDNISGFECRLKGGENKITWASISARGIKDDQGRLLYIDGVIEDVTESKGHEKQLELFAAIIEQADEEVVITDPEGYIQYVNPSFEKNTGYSANEVLGRTTSILKSGLHNKAFYRDLWETILARQTWKGVIKNKCKNGEILLHDTVITPIVDKNNTISSFVSIRRDITKQTQLENQIQQSQKIQAIGTLAGGIAHDFNNILSGIFGYCQLAQSNIQKPEKATDCISKALKAAQRATELVQQILTFSRQTEYEMKPYCVYPEINEALKLLRATIPVTIDIKHRLDSKSRILADPTRIHQLVMNLCTNAYHAMRKTGGVLTVCLSDREITEPRQINGKTMPLGKYLLLEISDTGQGMDQKTLKKIFEPYFTTKKKGEGTGLGLAIVQAIVEEHDGFIELTSAPGKGTHFYLYFPVVETQIESGKEKLESSPPQGKHEIVMIVDDEEDIRQAYREILETHGYQAVAFSDGDEALAAFTSEPQGYDILITDMTMPVKTGAELIKAVRSKNKNIPIILCTGFSEIMNAQKASQAGVSRYLNKPILPRDLLKTIRELLDGV